MTKTKNDHEASSVRVANDRAGISKPIGAAPSKRTIAFKRGISTLRDQRHEAGSSAGRLIPPFDAERVEAIQAAIDAGCFEPHPEVIADKIIENAEELLSRKR